MNRLRKQINNLLATYGGTLVRAKKHRVFHFPDGKQYVEASTPSSQDGDQKELAKLKRLLEVPKEEKSISAPREKSEKKQHAAPTFLKQTLIKSSTRDLSFSEKLANERTKLLEDELLMSQEHIEVLTSKIRDLRDQLLDYQTASLLAREYISRLETEIQDLQSRTCACLLCRIKRSWSQTKLYRALKSKTQPRSHKNQDSNPDTHSQKGSKT